MRPTIAFVVSGLPDYRERVVSNMRDSAGPGFRVYVGPEQFDATVRTAIRGSGYVSVVENRYLFGRRLLWQRLPFRSVLACDAVLAELNPRILSTWALLLVRRLIGRRTVLWGHAWPRSGRGSRSDVLRHLMRRMADAIVTYTETQQNELREVMGIVPVHAAPNAMYSLADMVAAQPLSGYTTQFIYVGRLVQAKKPGLLLTAFAIATRDLSTEVGIVFVGDGPERQDLERRARELQLDDRVKFTGHVADRAALQRLYSDAIASVSPGYVGLSITQSVGFGVPMIYATREPHAPEIEVVRHGFNARSFASDDEHALAAALVEFAEDRDEWLAQRADIAAWCRSRYTAEAMANRLVGVALGEADRGVAQS